jgi:hypothetical protein
VELSERERIIDRNDMDNGKGGYGEIKGEMERDRRTTNWRVESEML